MPIFEAAGFLNPAELVELVQLAELVQPAERKPGFCERIGFVLGCYNYKQVMVVQRMAAGRLVVWMVGRA